MALFSRIVCRLLVVMLGLLFGFGAGVLGVYYGFCFTFGELGRDDWGAAPIWLLAMAIGGLLGALVAAVAVFNWTLRVDFRAFNIFEWFGVLMGALAGGVFFQLLPERYYFYSRCIFMAATLPICVLIGFAVMNCLARALRTRETD